MQTAPEGDDDSWHEWRKRVKDLWYALRILKPVASDQLGAVDEAATSATCSATTTTWRSWPRPCASTRTTWSPAIPSWCRRRCPPGRDGLRLAAVPLGMRLFAKSPRPSRAGWRASGTPASPSWPPTRRGCRPSSWPRSGDPRGQGGGPGVGAAQALRRAAGARLPHPRLPGARAVAPGRVLGRRLRPAGREGHHPRGHPAAAARPGQGQEQRRPATAARPRHRSEPEPDPEPDPDPPSRAIEAQPAPRRQRPDLVRDPLRLAWGMARWARRRLS